MQHLKYSSVFMFRVHEWDVPFSSAVNYFCQAYLCKHKCTYRIHWCVLHLYVFHKHNKFKWWSLCPFAGKRTMQFCIFNHILLFSTSSNCFSDILIQKCLIRTRCNVVWLFKFNFFYSTTFLPWLNWIFMEVGELYFHTSCFSFLNVYT